MDLGRQKIDIDTGWNFIKNANVTFNPEAHNWFFDLCGVKQKLHNWRHQGTNWHKHLHDLKKLQIEPYLSEIIYLFLKAKVSSKILDYFKNKNPNLFTDLRQECWGSAYKEGFEYLYERTLDKDTFVYHYLTFLRIKNYEYSHQNLQYKHKIIEV